MKNLIIFDLDGVITSEESYWDCAGLTLHELLYSPRYWGLLGDTPYHPAATAQASREVSRSAFPTWLILSFKARALNSNWDTCYATVSLHLITLLSLLPESSALLPFQPWDATWLAALRTQIRQERPAWDIPAMHASWQARHPFDLPIFQQATGLAIFERLDAFASELLGYPVGHVFSRHLPFWSFCQNLFQEWLLGDALYESTSGHAPAQRQKPGCLFFEEPLLPPEQIEATLAALQGAGYTLGIASGRILQEAAQPLEKYDLWHYFAEAHRATYDVVIQAEEALRQQGRQINLGKPHPFHFQAALDREQALESLLTGQPFSSAMPALVVGDSTSDILGGQAAGTMTVAVLTGARSDESRALLLQSQPDFVIPDITGLPELLQRLESLAVIQKLQFTRREVAEKLLHLWFARQMDLAVTQVRLTPKAVSLNSFNGVYHSDGQDFFFKTHVEEQGILSEYYHADLLARAGYNVVRPLRLLREKDRQMVVYPVITWPVMFDLLRAQETGGELPAGMSIHTLIEAERQECERLLEIYARTYEEATDTSTAPIHQLFWHRLTGGRYQQFYSEQEIPLPDRPTHARLPWQQLLQAHWLINGVAQELTLGELVERGRQALDPARPMATVIGHGDAHFGNVFLEETRYLYFDPAFAGRHSPLLDIVKPCFHNVFAMWMYFPDEIARDLHLSVSFTGTQIIVEHNYRLPAVRQALVQTKQEHLLQPLVRWLAEREGLPENWQEFFRLALMCCPLLTVHLFDQEKRPPALGWLGLSQAVQLGNRGLDFWRDER